LLSQFLWRLMLALTLTTGLACQRSHFPGDPPKDTDAAWVAGNDSLRLTFMARDTGAASAMIPEAAQIFPIVLETALANARQNMAGFTDPHVYCLSLGPPQRLRVPPAELLTSTSPSDPSIVGVNNCDVDRGLGVWVLRPTQRRAWLLWVTDIGLIGDTATAIVGYHTEALMAAEWECSFHHDQNTWRLSQCAMRWIS
jgi:hypothetical protein